MAKRYDVMSPRPGREEGKTFWHRVGTGWVSEKEDGGIKVGIVFDSLPIPGGDGRVAVQLFEPREKDAPRERPADILPPGGNAPRAPAPGRQQLNDDIPF